MRFLFSAEYFYPSSGGGEHSVRSLLLDLQDRGHTVAAVHNGEDDPEIRSYTTDLPYVPGGWTRSYLYSMVWGRTLRTAIREEDPDYVITQLGLAPKTVEVCRAEDVSVVMLLINYSHICMTQFEHGDVSSHSCLRQAPLKFKWQYPFFRNIKKRYWTAMQHADHVLSNSAFMQQVTERFTGINSDVYYPIIDYDRVAVDTHDPQYITMVNPAPYKGGEIFVALAKRFPDQDFFALGSGGTQIDTALEELDNVTQKEYVEDMSDVYAQTKLLLAPSQWPEPFGMIGPEALYNGIPALVSDTGGLPEAVGHDALTVNNFRDPDTWEMKLQELLENPPELALQEHAEQFSVERQAAEFLEMVS